MRIIWALNFIGRKHALSIHQFNSSVYFTHKKAAQTMTEILCYERWNELFFDVCEWRRLEKRTVASIFNQQILENTTAAYGNHAGDRPGRKWSVASAVRQTPVCCPCSPAMFLNEAWQTGASRQQRAGTLARAIPAAFSRTALAQAGPTTNQISKRCTSFLHSIILSMPHVLLGYERCIRWSYRHSLDAVWHKIQRNVDSGELAERLSIASSSRRHSELHSKAILKLNVFKKKKSVLIFASFKEYLCREWRTVQSSRVITYFQGVRKNYVVMMVHCSGPRYFHYVKSGPGEK